MWNPFEGRDYLVQALVVVAVSTIVITAGFVGLLALVTGNVDNAGDRIPWYVLAMGVTFVTAVLYLSHRDADAETTLIASTGFGVLTLLWSFLSVEGLVFAVSQPAQVFKSHLLVYLLAAGLIATGLTAWLLQYWRAFTMDQTEREQAT